MLLLCGALVAACARGSETSAGGADTATAAAAAPAAATADGRAVFMRTCVTCHQQTGAGIQGTFPPLTENAVVTGDKARLIRLVLHGLTGPVMVKGVQYNNVMPPWKSLSDAEMAAVLTYVRSNFGNTADAVTAAEVAAERAATASRTTMWTAGDLDLH
jgi:mono/diheme cytochrome c family protein